MSVSQDEVVRQLETANFERQSLGTTDFEHEPNTPGDLTRVASVQARVATSLRPDAPIDLHIPVYREFTDDGSNNTETISLNHPLEDTPAVGDDVVVYRGDNRIEPAAVRYDADEVDVDTNGNSETYHVWYLSSEQARVVLRISAPRNFHNDVLDRDVGLANQRNQGRDPIKLDLELPLEGAVPTDYTLEWMVDAPYPVNYSPTGTDAQADNTLLLLPINRGDSTIEGLGALKRNIIAAEG
jgi:hypothetical protein